MADNRIAGTAFFTAGGTRYALVGEASYRVSTPKRETKTGLDGVHGVKETPSAGQIKVKIRDGSAVSLTALGQMIDETIMLELINGKTVIGRNMWFVGDEGGPSADADEAEIELTFEGPDVQD